MLCPICQSQAAPALTKDDCAYFECSQCSFLFYRPEEELKEGTVLSFYDRHYWEMERREAIRREQEEGFIRALELLYISSIPVENILDFGCGLAATVNLLRERLGANAIGVDISADFEETDYLHRCSLESMLGKYPPGFFDAIYSIEVFEHLEHPNDTVKELGRLLKAGGKILINTSTREFIAKHDPQQTYIDPLRRGHISIYSLASLSRAAETIGYTASFLGDHQYTVVLAPQGEPASYPNDKNLERLRRLGEWYPPLLREYMRLLFIEKEFEEKSSWMMSEVNHLHAEKAALFGELKRQTEAVEAWARMALWKRIWKRLTE